jgi:hypothetical protein
LDGKTPGYNASIAGQQYTITHFLAPPGLLEGDVCQGRDIDETGNYDEFVLGQCNELTIRQGTLPTRTAIDETPARLQLPRFGILNFHS